MATRRTGKDGDAGAASAKTSASGGASDLGLDQTPGSGRSSRMAREGVRTGEDFANLMSALMADVLEGNVSPNIVNAAVNAGGKLLKVVEMQYRYGSQREQRETLLVLAPGGRS